MLGRGEAYEQAERHPEDRDGGDPAADLCDDLKRSADMSQHDCDKERSDYAEPDAGREAEGDRVANGPGALVVGLVDLVDRAHDGANRARDVPEGEERGEDDQARAVSGEDLLDRDVDRVRGRRLEMALDRRRD